MNDVYRPTVRINKQTPVTFGELDTHEIKRAKTEKYKKDEYHDLAKPKKDGNRR